MTIWISLRSFIGQYFEVAQIAVFDSCKSSNILYEIYSKLYKLVYNHMVWKIVCASPDQVKPKTIKLELAASPLSTNH